MAWASRTYVTSEIITASIMNSYIRDPLLETAPAKASGTGGIFVSTGTNAIAQRVPKQTIVGTTQTTTSTSYTDLATAGPAVTVTTGTEAVAFFGAAIRNTGSTSRTYMALEVSGATSISAADAQSLSLVPSATTTFDEFGHFYFFDSLTAGSNVITVKYKVDGGTGSYARRRLFVIPL